MEHRRYFEECLYVFFFVHTMNVNAVQWCLLKGVKISYFWFSQKKEGRIHVWNNMIACRKVFLFPGWTILLKTFVDTTMLPLSVISLLSCSDRGLQSSSSTLCSPCTPSIGTMTEEKRTCFLSNHPDAVCTEQGERGGLMGVSGLTAEDWLAAATVVAGRNVEMQRVSRATAGNAVL